MNEMVERVAVALEHAEVGYSLRLTRLVDNVSTYTLTYDDGTLPLEFSDNSEAYAHIAAKKLLKAARLAVEAMREPTEAMERAGDGETGYPVANVRSLTVWQAMIDAELAGE